MQSDELVTVSASLKLNPFNLEPYLYSGCQTTEQQSWRSDKQTVC